MLWFSLIALIAAFSTSPPGHEYKSHQPSLNGLALNQGWIMKGATTNAPLVYAASNGTPYPVVYVFRQDTGALIGEISWDLIYPWGLATDTAGNLYVANGTSGYNAVLIYPPGSVFPSGYLIDPQAASYVVVGGDGSAYVSNRFPPSIFVYPPGSSQPSYELFDKRAAVGFALALDSRGNLYWAFTDGANPPVGHVDKFAHAHGKPIDLGISLNSEPQGITFDRGGDLVISQPADSVIDIFELPNTLSAQIAQLGCPAGIALNAFQSIFVADGCVGPQLEQYKYPTGTLVKTMQTNGFLADGGVAVFPNTR